MRGRRRRGEARALREHMGQAVGCLGRYVGWAVPGMGSTRDGRAVWGPGGALAERNAGRAGGTHQGLLSPSILL